MNYIYKLLDNNNDIIYIGKTNDIDRRMKQHMKTGKWEFVSDILVMKTKTAFDCDLIERFLIVKHKPKYNITHNKEEHSTKINIDGLPNFEKWEFKNNEDDSQIFDEEVLDYLKTNGFEKICEDFYTNEDFIIGVNYEGVEHKYIINHFMWSSPSYRCPPSLVKNLSGIINYIKGVYDEIEHSFIV